MEESPTPQRTRAKTSRQRGELLHTRLIEIESTIPFSQEVEKIITRLEDFRGVLCVGEEGEEIYNQLNDEVVLWARIERLRPFIGEELPVYHVSKYLGLSDYRVLEKRLDTSKPKPVISKTIRVLTRERMTEVGELSETIGGMVVNKEDAEFLSCLSRNADILRELDNTRPPQRLMRIVFEHVVKIASRCFSFKDSQFEVLRATEGAALRARIIPAKGRLLSEVVKAAQGLVDADATDLLLEKVRASKGPFVIDSWETYAPLLRTLPLILAEPSFESYHREMKGRLLLKKCISHDESRAFGRSKRTTGSPSFYEYVNRLENYCKNGLEGIVLRKRELVAEGILSVQDVLERLESYYRRDHVRERPHFAEELRHCEQNIAFYSLRRVGLRASLLQQYDTQELSKGRHVKPQNIISNWDSGFNNLLNLVLQIPRESPEEGCLWIEMERGGGGEGLRVKQHWIQVPTELRADNVGRIVEQLGIPTEPEEREQHFRVLERNGVSREQFSEWKERYGEVETFEQKMDALAYLAGLMLSDGTIENNIAKLGLSSSYAWSKEMGERFLYYWCCLGIGIKRSDSRELVFRKIYLKTLTLFPIYLWNTQSSGFLDFFHEKVLGLPRDGTHTDFCSKAEWLLKMPEKIRIAFLQGFFDGDGVVNSLSVDKFIGAAADTQTPFVRKILDSVGIQSTGGPRNITIKRDFLLAVDKPIIRSAYGKLETVERLSRIVDSMNHSVEYVKRHSLSISTSDTQTGLEP